MEEIQNEVKENTTPETPKEEQPKEPLKDSDNTDYKAELEKEKKLREDAEFAALRMRKKIEKLETTLKESGIELEKEGISEDTIANIVEEKVGKIAKAFESKFSELARAFKSKESISTTPSGAGQKPLQEEKPPESNEEERRFLKKHPDWVWSPEKKRYISPALAAMEKRGEVKVRGGVIE